ncbi:MAG TPA: alpha/beta hydrolase, partial [Polyangiaceae bacterium]|nr:alpha/beta hydrolase [Polyangiaceae bacterium]
CIKNGLAFAEFLLELASHGFVIVSDGAPNGSGGGALAADGTALTQAVDWALAQNDQSCSKYHRKLDPTKIAAMGQSCGGLMTMGAAKDRRLRTIVLWNSGLFSRDQTIYNSLHAPMAIIDGGASDIAYVNGEADFNAISTVPIVFANRDVGHIGTYFQDNGGEFARVGLGWLKWQLLGDPGASAAGLFVGASCGLCNASSGWTLRKKGID